LWGKLSRLDGQRESVAGGTGKSTGTDGQVTGFGVHTAEVGSVNQVCAECDKFCKQPEGKFVETFCPLPGKDRVRRYYNQPEVSSRKIPDLEKINPTCSRCRRNCKQSTEKLNLILCPGLEPIDSPPAESG